jgi:hypothetical protein
VELDALALEHQAADLAHDHELREREQRREARLGDEAQRDDQARSRAAAREEGGRPGEALDRQVVERHPGAVAAL